MPLFEASSPENSAPLREYGPACRPLWIVGSTQTDIEVLSKLPAEQVDLATLMLRLRTAQYPLSL